MKIVTLATSHNRKHKTLAALKSLHNQTLPDNVRIQHVVVDDGSVDHTSEMINKYFPNVVILKGTGNLYWAGGMRFGWREYVKNIDFDLMLLYNDDVYLEPDALIRLLNTSAIFQYEGGCKDHVVVGSFHDGATPPITTYGGLLRGTSWHPLRFRIIDPPKEKYTCVETLNMNSCLITKALIDKVGFLSDYFIHSGADFEFGLKTIKAGGKVVLAHGYLGECKRNLMHDNFIESSRSLIDCYMNFLGTKQQPFLQRLRYFKTHGGYLWVVFFASPYLYLPFKYAWLKFLRFMVRGLNF